MSSILLPALALMLVTMLVWLNMLLRRVIFAKKYDINPQQLVTPEQLTAVYDDRTNAIGNCFKNMFEVPVIFYALVAFILLSNSTDIIFVNLAWAFVGLRALQAVVHCTYNRVMHRFLAYLASTLILWLMLIRLFVVVFD